MAEPRNIKRTSRQRLTVDPDALVANLEEAMRDLVKRYCDARLEELVGDINAAIAVLADDLQTIKNLTDLMRAHQENLIQRMAVVEDHLIYGHPMITTPSPEEPHDNVHPIRRPDDGD